MLHGSIRCMGRIWRTDQDNGPRVTERSAVECRSTSSVRVDEKFSKDRTVGAAQLAELKQRRTSSTSLWPRRGDFLRSLLLCVWRRSCGIVHLQRGSCAVPQCRIVSHYGGEPACRATGIPCSSEDDSWACSGSFGAQLHRQAWCSCIRRAAAAAQHRCGRCKCRHAPVPGGCGSHTRGSPSLQLKGSEHQAAFDMLQLFAYGTYDDYKGMGFGVCPDPAA